MGRKNWLERVAMRKVMVHLDTDTSVEGFIADTSLDGLLLRSATLHAGNGTPTEMAGETWVPRERIVFVQGVD